MIKVDRTGREPPEILTREDDGRSRGGRRSAAKELRKAKASFDAWVAAGKDPGDWSYGFSIYKDDEVREALEALFHGKCAYCETRYASTQPMDVEHWRPKNQVELADGTAKKPAYYWLAASWDNLLPSCIDCNRKRNQVDALTHELEPLGKLDQFPLADEASRAERPGDEVDEEPLLLHPCRDDPQLVLQYDASAVVTPRVTTGLDLAKAKASIRVFALNRTMLVLQRKEHADIVRLRLATITALATLLVEHDALPEPVVIAIEDVILHEMRAVQRARDPKRPYTALTREIVDAHLADLRALGIDLDA